MPLVVQQGGGGPRDFTLVAAPGGAPLTPGEQDCQARVNGFAASLAALTDDGTPRGGELVKIRNACLDGLRARADELTAGTITPEALFGTSYLYQGRFEEQVRHLQASVFQVSPQLDGHRVIGVSYDITEGTTTQDQLDLKRAIDDAVVVVNEVLSRPQDEARRRTYLDRLVGIGRVGLMENNIGLAKGDLESMKYEFVARQASAVKNKYVRGLGVWALGWVVVNTLLYVAVQTHIPFPPGLDGWYPVRAQLDFLGSIAVRFQNFFLLAIGAAIGAWLAFLIRRPLLAFADLVQLDDDLLRSSIRILFTIVLGTVIGLLFWTGLVVITVGSFKSESFRTAGTTAMLIGVFAGIASRALATAVAGRAQDFAGGAGSAGQPVVPPRVA